MACGNWRSEVYELLWKSWRFEIYTDSGQLAAKKKEKANMTLEDLSTGIDLLKQNVIEPTGSRKKEKAVSVILEDPPTGKDLLTTS